MIEEGQRKHHGQGRLQPAPAGSGDQPQATACEAALK
jgi:hypothetical protein